MCIDCRHRCREIKPSATTWSPWSRRHNVSFTLEACQPTVAREEQSIRTPRRRTRSGADSRWSREPTSGSVPLCGEHSADRLHPELPSTWSSMNWQISGGQGQSPSRRKSKPNSGWKRRQPRDGSHPGQSKIDENLSPTPLQVGDVGPFGGVRKQEFRRQRRAAQCMAQWGLDRHFPVNTRGASDPQICADRDQPGVESHVMRWACTQPVPEVQPFTIRTTPPGLDMARRQHARPLPSPDVPAQTAEHAPVPVVRENVTGESMLADARRGHEELLRDFRRNIAVRTATTSRAAIRARAPLRSRRVLSVR